MGTSLGCPGNMGLCLHPPEASGGRTGLPVFAHRSFPPDLWPGQTGKRWPTLREAGPVLDRAAELGQVLMASLLSDIPLGLGKFAG